MKKHFFPCLILTVALTASVCLFSPEPTSAMLSEVEEGTYIEVLYGESVTLKSYAGNLQTETYSILTGSASVRDNGNGSFTFIGYNSYYPIIIQSTVYDMYKNVLSTHQWYFNVRWAYPTISEDGQPQSVTVLSGEKATFTVGTRQEDEFLSFRWICTDTNGKQVSAYRFADATGWTSRTLIINDCKAYMNGYKFYCIISLADNQVYQSRTTTDAGVYPTLYVNTHPVESGMTVQELESPKAGIPVDYEISVFSNKTLAASEECAVSSVSYFVDGAEISNYVPEPGDSGEIRITLTPAEEYGFSASDYYLLWNDFENVWESGNQDAMTFAFQFSIPLNDEESGREEEETEKPEEHDSDEREFNLWNEPIFRYCLGGLIIAAVLGLFVFLVIRKNRKEKNDKENE